MNQDLKMYAYNSTQHSIKNFKIEYKCGEKSVQLRGQNLASHSRSESTTIKTGILYHDNFEIVIDFDDRKHKSTSFYCLSSIKHKCVEIAIHEDYVNCHYYTEDTPANNIQDTSCMNKAYAKDS